MSETRINQMTAVQKEALELFIKKNSDYGDAFATYKTVGVIVRMCDKIQRLISISNKGIALTSDALNFVVRPARNAPALAIVPVPANAALIATFLIIKSFHPLMNEHNGLSTKIS